jgi:spermidine/putrescine-binding protein
MKKLFKSMLTCALATTMVFSAVACSPEVIEQVDETKSQLYVFNYNGGVGSAWITKAQEDFAKAFENYSFEDGKKGVQFMPENAKTAELQTIANTNNEVIFSEIANSTILSRSFAFIFMQVASFEIPPLPGIA